MGRRLPLTTCNALRLRKHSQRSSLLLTAALGSLPSCGASCKTPLSAYLSGPGSQEPQSHAYHPTLDHEVHGGEWELAA